MLNPEKRARLWKRTWIGAAMVVSLAAILWLGARPGGERVILWTGVVLALVASVEMTRMRALVEGRWPIFTAAAILGTAAWIERAEGWPAPPERTFALLGTTLAWALACGLASLVVRWRASVARWGAARAWRVVFLSAWVAAPLPWLAVVRGTWGPAPLAALVFLSKIGDMVALYVGSAIGRTHPFPRISPGKTTAGCVASLVAGIVLGGIFQWVGWLATPRHGVLTGLAAGACVNVAAQAGDLFKSLVKRWSGVKDSGTVFGPAGGVLDMVDSLLFTVPCALVTWPLLYEWPD